MEILIPNPTSFVEKAGFIKIIFNKNMCANCKDGCCCKGAHCTTSKIGNFLLIAGGLNWGLMGLGMLLGSVGSWNVINMLLGSIPLLEGLVYLLVGISALVKIFGCRCKKCKEGVCMSCGGRDTMSGGGMGGKNEMKK